MFLEIRKMNMNTNLNLNLKEWKEISDGKNKVRYHLFSENYVDTIVINEDDKEFAIRYEILSDQPYDLLTIQTSKPYNKIKIYIEKNDKAEDPAFSYPEFYENRKPEEIIQDIKSYILDLVSYFLNLS